MNIYFWFGLFLFGFNSLIASEANVVVENLKITNEHVLSFSAMNTHFEGSIMESSVATYSEGMELEVLETNTIHGKNGETLLKVKFLNLLTGEEAVLISRPIHKIIGVENEIHAYQDDEFYPATGGNHGSAAMVRHVAVVTRWRIHLTLEDGSKIALVHPKDSMRLYNSHAHLLSLSPSLLNVGENIQILAEWQGDAGMQKNVQSHFRVEQLVTGAVFEGEGDTHHPQGFGQK